MEIVDFYPRRLRDIPEQDNPIYDSEARNVIVRDAGGDGALVLRGEGVNDGATAEYVAIFWDHKKAVEYCHCMVSLAAINFIGED